jgi:hypothetical protein
MRLSPLILLVALTACGNVHHDLPHTSSRDPVWQLNPDKWAANANELTTPPVRR